MHAAMQLQASHEQGGKQILRSAAGCFLRHDGPRLLLTAVQQPIHGLSNRLESLDHFLFLQGMAL